MAKLVNECVQNFILCYCFMVHAGLAQAREVDRIGTCLVCMLRQYEALLKVQNPRRIDNLLARFAFKGREAPATLTPFQA